MIQLIGRLYMKILIGCPIHFYKAYAMERFVKYIDNMRECSIHESDVLLCDNTPPYPNGDSTKMVDYVDELAPHWEVDFLKDPPSGGKWDIHNRIKDSRNIIRQRVIDGKYDYFFSVECDVYPPKETMDVLISKFKNDNMVVSGLYYRGFFQGYNKKSLEKRPRGVLGLTVIPRQVLEKVKFRFPEETLRGFDDAYFYHDLEDLKIPHFVWTGIKAEHWQQNGPGYAMSMETGLSMKQQRKRTPARRRLARNGQAKRVMTRASPRKRKYRSRR